MRRRLLAGLVGVALATLAATWLLAQPVTQNVVTGQECWNAGQGPGGPSNFLCVNVVSGRNAQAVLSAVSGNTTVGTTTNVTVTGSTQPSVVVTGGDLLVTAQPSAAVWTMPPSPIPDGAIIGICNTTSAAWLTNAQTVAGNAGQTSPTNNTITTLGAGTCARFQWSLTNTTWYRVQ